MILDSPVARAVLFFLVPVAVSMGLSVAFGDSFQYGILVGVAVGIPFAIYGAFFVSPASDDE